MCCRCELARFVLRDRSWRFPVLAALCLLTAGCVSYDDFTLPPCPPRPTTVRISWQVLAEPVLQPGPPGSWDAVDVLNPVIFRWRDRYFNLYSGFDGATWHTGLATSTDGLRWQKLGRVLSPDPRSWEGSYIAANGTALVLNDTIHYWYQAGDPPQVGLATSRDGLRWTKLPSPVLRPGPRGSWDEMGVADPYVLRVGQTLYMYFLGQDRARRQRLGLATSNDGVHWVKLRSNPVLDLGPPGSFDEVGLGEPAVWRAFGRYWMLYTGRDRHERRRIGIATSSDGVRWSRLPPDTLLSGDQPWNSSVVCDPEVEPHPFGARVWFGGGRVPHPAENIQGRIGVAFLNINEEGATLP